MRTITFLSLLFLVLATAQGQIRQFPYAQNFDSAVSPVLPAGWHTSSNRSSGGDFTITRSTPRSDSNAVISTNATIAQTLSTPVLNFSNWAVDSLSFYERRSGTHNSGVLIEASLDGGTTFLLRLSDTLRNTGVTSYFKRIVTLPTDLDNADNVILRWRVIGNGTGTTGTLRYDDITISARARIDAAVSSISFTPELPVAGEAVTISASITNTGLDVINAFTIEFYIDQNNDSIPDFSELLDTKVFFQSMNPLDSTLVETLIPNISHNDKCVMIQCILSDDQNQRNNIFNKVLTVGYPPQTVVINEIMYAPESPEPEWIEITTTSEDSINLASWRLSDRNTRTQYKIDAKDLWLSRNQFLVITKDSANFTSTHPAVAHFITLRVMPASLFNNDSDAVALLDHRGKLMDSVYYHESWRKIDGTSLERIEPLGISNERENWDSSEDSTGSTPGRQNYLTPLDVNIKGIRIIPKEFSDTHAAVSVIGRNIGRSIINECSVSLYINTRNDSLIHPDELMASKTLYSAVTHKDSVTVDFEWERPSLGYNTLIAVISTEQDMRSSDDIIFGSIVISYPEHALIINEIMYEPKSGKSEYVELYNPSPIPVDIEGWKLSDRRDTNKNSNSNILAKSSLIIPSHHFLVIASDSSLLADYNDIAFPPSHCIVKRNGLGLNNTGDNIIVFDRTGKAIDSIRFLPTWHNSDVEDVTGRSLERINPFLAGTDNRNWSTCADPSGGSPGKQNTIFTVSVQPSSNISFSPNPFSPDGDGYEDVTILSYELPEPTGTIRVRIFDAKGRLVRTLASGEPTGAHGQLIWNGYNDRDERVRMGIYIILLEAFGANGGEMHKIKSVVVVAGQM